jgi:hypothetical protein
MVVDHSVPPDLPPARHIFDLADTSWTWKDFIEAMPAKSRDSDMLELVWVIFKECPLVKVEIDSWYKRA